MARGRGGDDMLSRVQLLVELDKKGYNAIRNNIDAVFRDRRKLQLDTSDVSKFADKMRDVFGEIEGMSRDTIDKFDTQAGSYLVRAESLRKELQALVDVKAQKEQAVSGLDEGQRDKWLQRIDKAYDKQIKALVEQKDQLDDEFKLQVKGVKDQAANLKKQKKAAKDWQKAMKPDLKKFRAASMELGEGFIDTLSKLKAGDVQGVFKGVAGGLAGASEKAGGAADMAKAAAATEGAAASMGALLGVASVFAGVAAVAVGAIAAVVAVMVAADEQAKEFNKTLLDGAGAADFAFSNAATAGQELDTTLGSARKASQMLALRWRGQAKDYAHMIGQISEAGITWEEMTAGAETADEQMRAFEKHAETALVWSKALGITVQDVAEQMNRWASDMGIAQADLNEEFATFVQYAQASGMGTKRFYSAISQATSGMALYNIRTAEAAQLLAMTAKILGETDASEFIKSLTKGFVDESYQDRYKRLMLAGSDAVNNFTASLASSVERFADTFAKNDSIKDAFKVAMGDAALDIDLGNPKVLSTEIGKMTGDQMSTLRASLFHLSNQGDTQAAAALKQLQTITDLQKATSGKTGDMALGMDSLDMKSTMALKLDNFMGKNLSEANGLQMMAIENTQGLSGEGLFQMRRMSGVMLDLYKYEMKSTGQVVGGQAEFLQWVRTSDLASQVVEAETVEVMDLATSYAKANVSSTTSLLTVLETGIQVVLEQIYDVMQDIYGTLTFMAPEQKRIQKEMLSSNKTDQAGIRDDLQELALGIEAQNRIVETGDKGQRAAALLEKGKLESKLAAKEGELAAAITQHREIASGNIDTPEYSEAKWDYVTDKATEAAESTALFLGRQALSQMIPGFDPLVMASGLYGGGEQGEEATELTEEEMAILENQVELDKKSGKVETQTRDWFLKHYPNKTETAVEDALRKIEAEKIAGTLDIPRGDYAAVVGEIAENLKSGKVGAKSDYYGYTPGMDVNSPTGTSSTTTPAATVNYGTSDPNEEEPPPGPEHRDFIMRPGQRATSFSPDDTIIGTKGALPGGGSTTINITINGGDQSKVYQTVKDALKNSGLRP